MSATAQTRPNPYVGPRAFLQGETLYGRDRELMELLDLLIAERITLLHSPSGAGKTSLIQAALVPALEKEGFQVLPVMRVSLEPPLHLTQAANRFVLSLLLSLEQALPEEQQTAFGELSTLSLADYVHQRHKALDDADSIVLVFDQFEEILTIDPTAQASKAEFFAQVGATLRDRRHWALFAMREEFLAGLASYLRPIPTRLSTTYRLELLRKREAHLAIQRPAQQAGVKFTDAAAGKLVDDLRKVRVQRPDGTAEERPGLYVEPVQLQVVCRRLWDRLPSGAAEVRESDIEAVGDVDSALAGYYEERLLTIARESGVSEGAIREWFGESLITEYGIRGQVLREPKRSQGLDNQVIDRMVDAHLVRAERRRGVTWYELVHDRFVAPIQVSNQSWQERRRQRLFTTLGAIAATLFVIMIIAFGAAQISRSGQASQIEQAQSTAMAAAGEVSELAMSVNRARVRPLRPGLSVSSVTETASTVGGFVRDERGRFYLLILTVATDPKDCASHAPIIQPGTADGGQAPDDVVGYLDRCPPLADGVPFANMVGLARLGESIAFETDIPGIGPIRGVRDPVLGTRVRMLGRTSGLVTGEITGIEGTAAIGLGQGSFRFVNGVTVSRISAAGDGGALVVDDEGFVVGVDVAGSSSATLLAPMRDILDGLGVKLLHLGQELLVLRGHRDEVHIARWNRDGSLILTVSNEGTARVWDARTGAEMFLFGLTDPVELAQWNAQESLILTAGADGTARVWDAESGEQLLTLSGHTARVNQAVWNAEGSLILTASADRTARVWDVSTMLNTDIEAGKARLTLAGHGGGVTDAMWSADESRILTVSDDGKARVWDARTGTVVAFLVGHTDSIKQASWKVDGSRILTASADDTARVWDAETGEELAVLSGHTAGVNAAAWNADESRILTVSNDGTARVWDARTGAEMYVFGLTDPVELARWNAEGSFILTASADGTARVWDAESGEQMLTLSGHTARVNQAVWNAEESFILTASADGTARVWNAERGEELAVLSGHTGAVRLAAWSADGTRILSASADGTARVWQGR